MSNGIKRRRSLGIALENAYGVYTGTTSTYALALLDSNTEEVVNKAENNSMLGSTYEVNNSKIINKYSNISYTVKVDENVLPLLFKQKFDIASAVISGETTVYKHTLTYKNANAVTSGQSYALFIDDPDRDDMKLNGARFNNIDILGSQDGFVTLELSGMAQFPEKVAVTNAIDFTTREFVGRNIAYTQATYTGTLATQKLTGMNIKHNFNLSDMSDNILLGDEEPSDMFTKQDRFEADCTALYSDNDIRDAWANNTRQKSQIVIEDTDRYVTGSVTNINPSITIGYPVQTINSWTKEGGADDIMKQSYTLLALDDPSVATAPITIEIINGVASY